MKESASGDFNFSVWGDTPHTPLFLFNLKSNFLIQAIVEVAAYARKMHFRHSRLCGDAFDAADTVRSAIPEGFKF